MTGPSFEPFASIAAFPVLTTERLILREIIWDDLPWYVRHFSLPEIVEGRASRRRPTNRRHAPTSSGASSRRSPSVTGCGGGCV